MVYSREMNYHRRQIEVSYPIYTDLALLDSNEILFSMKGSWSAQALLALRSYASVYQKAFNQR